MINIETFVFNPFMENTYLLHDDTGECIIVDAGCYEDAEKKEIEVMMAVNPLTDVPKINLRVTKKVPRTNPRRAKKSPQKDAT